MTGTAGPSSRMGGAAVAVAASALCLAGPVLAQGFRAVGNTDPNHRAPPWHQGEVVVTFDTMPTKVSFDLPGHIKLITENGIPYINGATETYIDGFAEGQSYESWNDIQNEYSRMWIESQNDARIVVRHRCALVNKGNIAHAGDKQVAPYGPGNWVDEWYTFHPDGTHVRRIKIYSSRARQSSCHRRERGVFFYELEGMYLWWGAPRAGTMASDHLEDGVVTLLLNDGRSRTIDFTPYPMDAKTGRGMAEAYGEFRHASISVINTKSEYRPWRIGRPSEKGGAFWGQSLLLTPYRPVHKLVQLVPCFPSNTTRQSGYSVAGLGQVIYSNFWKLTDTSMGEIWLNGFIDADGDPAKDLPALSRSWWNAPPVAVVERNGVVAHGYDVGARAYLIDVEKAKSPKAAHVALAGSARSPVVNPTFLINNWGTKTPELKIDGKAVSQGKDFRAGRYETLDLEDGREWKDVLVVWAKFRADKPTRFTIQPKGHAARPGAPSRPPTPPRDSRNEKAERLYKLAPQAERSGQRGAAASMYRKIAKDYEGTDAARKASERLKAMGR
ncbi:MAG: tetratricopeptide repeat protein [Planctomycetota bacterium]